MKNITTAPTLLVIAALLGACGSIPNSTTLLDQVHSDFMAAQINPSVTQYAPLELKQSGELLQQADRAAAGHEKAGKIDELAYLAKQQLALAQEIGKQKTAEANVASSAAERDQMRLAQRTGEADQAREDADRARRDAGIAMEQTANAQRDSRDAQARAAQLEAQLAELAAKKTEHGMVITFGDVLFGTDLARLNPDGLRGAQKLADLLQQNPLRTVLIEGFTDSTGSAGHNQELSERRAGAVRAALIEMGIAGERVAMRGYGEAHPAASNATAAERQMNRRVEIILSDASGKVARR